MGICHHSLTMAESLNKGIFPEIIPTGPDICKQQWQHEDHWEMPNPLIGYDDPQYHNHDPDEDVDEEWFKGRDGWDKISLTKKKKKSQSKVLETSLDVMLPTSPNSTISPPC